MKKLVKNGANILNPSFIWLVLPPPPILVFEATSILGQLGGGPLWTPLKQTSRKVKCPLFLISKLEISTNLKDFWSFRKLFLLLFFRTMVPFSWAPKVKAEFFFVKYSYFDQNYWWIWKLLGPFLGTLMLYQKAGSYFMGSQGQGWLFDKWTGSFF